MSINRKAKWQCEVSNIISSIFFWLYFITNCESCWEGEGRLTEMGSLTCFPKAVKYGSMEQFSLSCRWIKLYKSSSVVSSFIYFDPFWRKSIILGILINNSRILKQAVKYAKLFFVFPCSFPWKQYKVAWDHQKKKKNYKKLIMASNFLVVTSSFGLITNFELLLRVSISLKKLLFCKY